MAHAMMEAKKWTKEASGIIQSESEGPRTRRAEVWGQKMDISAQTDKVNSPFLSFLFSWGLQQVGSCPPALGRAAFFTQSTNANAHLF